MEEYSSEIEFIESLQKEFPGNVSDNNKKKNALLEFKENNYYLKIEGTLSLDVDEYLFSFITDSLNLFIRATAIANATSIDQKFVLRYAKCKVYSFHSSDWQDSYSLYRSFFYTSSKNLLYAVFGKASKIKLTVDHQIISIRQLNNYIIIQNDAELSYENFSIICYNVLVALGFVSGVFIQDAVFTFQRDDESEMIFKYEKLRKGFKSIYQPFTINPFGYKHYLGNETAEKIYQEDILKYLRPEELSTLAELSLKNSEIQYALVLFNEANSNDLSLLIRNNCFFVVIEILRKFFYEKFKTELPSNYSQYNNMLKIKMVFECFMPVTNEEILLMEKRNVFMHGDIKNMEDKEMVAIMQSQLTFICKAVFSYIGFEGYVIDHYAIRNNKIEQAFIKVNNIKS